MTELGCYKVELGPHLMVVVGDERLLVGIVLFRCPEPPSHALHLRPHRIRMPQTLLRQLPVALRCPLQQCSQAAEFTAALACTSTRENP